MGHQTGALCGICAGQLGYSLLGGLAVKDITIYCVQIIFLYPAVKLHGQRRMRFAAAQVMHNGDNGVTFLTSQTGIEPKQRGVIQFILQQQIHIERTQAVGKRRQPVVKQIVGVSAPRHGDNFNGVPLRLQIFDQHAVVQIAARDDV